MKVLVVEDNAPVRRAYGRMLRDHEVILAEDPIEAQKQLNGGFQPDVIISDWDMPQMNGGEFCELLRAAGNDTPFFIVSGEMRLSEAAECGADGSYVKPLSKSDLEYILKR